MKSRTSVCWTLSVSSLLMLFSCWQHNCASAEELSRSTDSDLVTDGAAESTSTSDTPRFATYQDNDVYIQVSGPPHHLVMSLSVGGEPHQTLDIPNEIGVVDAVQRVKGAKVAVIGEVNADGREMLLYDMESGKVLDNFLAYGPKISPDGLFIAFTKFFPSHFVTEEQASNYAMIYDLSRSAKSNRPRVRDSDQDSDVGQLIYPKSRQAIALKDGSAHKPTHSFVDEGFFWSPDSSKYVFLDEQYPGPEEKHPPQNLVRPPRAILSIVLVDINSQPPKVSIWPTGMCATEWGKSCLVGMRDVQFSETGITAKMQGYQLAGNFKRDVQVSFDQFVPVR